MSATPSGIPSGTKDERPPASDFGDGTRWNLVLDDGTIVHQEVQGDTWTTTSEKFGSLDADAGSIGTRKDAHAYDGEDIGVKIQHAIDDIINNHGGYGVVIINDGAYDAVTPFATDGATHLVVRSRSGQRESARLNFDTAYERAIDITDSTPNNDFVGFKGLDLNGQGQVDEGIKNDTDKAPLYIALDGVRHLNFQQNQSGAAGASRLSAGQGTILTRCKWQGCGTSTGEPALLLDGGKLFAWNVLFAGCYEGLEFGADGNFYAHQLWGYQNKDVFLRVTNGETTVSGFQSVDNKGPTAAIEVDKGGGVPTVEFSNGIIRGADNYGAYLYDGYSTWGRDVTIRKCGKAGIRMAGGMHETVATVKNNGTVGGQAGVMLGGVSDCIVGGRITDTRDSGNETQGGAVDEFSGASDNVILPGYYKHDDSPAYSLVVGNGTVVAPGAVPAYTIAEGTMTLSGGVSGVQSLTVNAATADEFVSPWVEWEVASDPSFNADYGWRGYTEPNVLWDESASNVDITVRAEFTTDPGSGNDVVLAYKIRGRR